MATNNEQGKGDEFWALLQTDEAKQAVETAERGTVTVGVNLRTGELVQHDPLAADVR